MVRILQDMDGVHCCPLCGLPGYREMGAGSWHCTDHVGCGHVWSEGKE